jgi:PKD repeat protein
MLLYADDPFVTGISGCDDGNHPNGPSDGALEGGLSHEHNESISDPLPNDAWTNGAGLNQGLEIGDQCDGIMGTALGTAPNGALYNQVIDGHFYWYQEEWSNQGHTCLQRFTLSGTEPTAKFTVAASGGLTMTFNASGSKAAGGVAEYSWQFNDAFGAQTVERTSPIITHTFPTAGAYSVGLTVYGHGGLSKGAGGIVTTGQNGFTPGFTVTPANPAAGQPVTFSGLKTVSAEPVMTYLWEFGDGSTGSGPNPTHVYSTVGAFKVTVVMFSGVGSAFPGAGAGPVFTEKITVS